MKEKFIIYTLKNGIMTCKQSTDIESSHLPTFYKLKSFLAISRLKKSFITVDDTNYLSLWNNLKTIDTSDFVDVSYLHESLEESHAFDRLWETMNRLGDQLGKYDLLIICGLIAVAIICGMAFPNV